MTLKEVLGKQHTAVCQFEISKILKENEINKIHLLE